MLKFYVMVRMSNLKYTLFLTAGFLVRKLILNVIFYSFTCDSEYTQNLPARTSPDRKRRGEDREDSAGLFALHLILDYR